MTIPFTAKLLFVAVALAPFTITGAIVIAELAVVRAFVVWVRQGA